MDDDDEIIWRGRDPDETDDDFEDDWPEYDPIDDEEDEDF